MARTKTLGIVGGIGPESTVDYYSSLIYMWREQTNDGSAPSIMLNSIDLRKMLDFIAANALSEVAVNARAHAVHAQSQQLR